MRGQTIKPKMPPSLEKIEVTFSPLPIDEILKKPEELGNLFQHE